MSHSILPPTHPSTHSHTVSDVAVALIEVYQGTGWAEALNLAISARVREKPMRAPKAKKHRVRGGHVPGRGREALEQGPGEVPGGGGGVAEEGAGTAGETAEVGMLQKEGYRC